ncbi:metallophosphoesterase [uncultured Proteiniphilum sp.]|uniref:metallophosphoesterase family protein n=1 Tax=uncultured Proteiniphilum sp. TaxID=497637 RepID=UPI002636BB7B|nr:metallophosphoesterase [uncultured Proteiniphilum sp.]
MRSKVCLIHDIGAVFILLFTLFTGCASSGAPGAVKIAVITDIHFLDTLLAAEGESLFAYEKATGRNITDLHAVLDAVLDDLKEEAPDLLLVTGDITNHGEKQSHLGFIEKLRLLQSRGTRILVIPGNHDINIPDAKAYRGNQATPAETVSKEEFVELYAPFGYSDALKRDKASLSYLAEINEGVWLLCFDTNRYEEHTTTSVTGGRILPETMDWALDILYEAKEKGITVLGMMHHGLVEHMPYQAAFFPQYLIDEWEKNAGLLADTGLKVVFTGHFHANDITMHTSSAGNILYDVETASLAQYPFAYRIMELNDTGLSIDTRFVAAIPGNADLAAVYRDKLEAITRRVARNRLDGLDIPMPEETLDALTDVIVKLNLIHVRGDEKPDMALKMAIRIFADLMGSEADQDSFAFDFPPEDNRVVIPFQ